MKLKLILCMGILFLHAGQGFAASFTDNGDDTITDSSTNLIWVKTETTQVNWETALSTCAGLTHASTTDWRLPNRNELQSLADYTKVSGVTIDTTYFPDATAAYYWSSSANGGNASSAWFVNFDGGNLGVGNMTVSSYVRCVR